MLLQPTHQPVQDKLRQLGGEYERRVTVAAAEARLTALRQAAEEQRQLEQQAEDERLHWQQQLLEAQQAAAAALAAAADAAELERAQHAAELARIGEQHSNEVASLKVG